MGIGLKTTIRNEGSNFLNLFKHLDTIQIQYGNSIEPYVLRLKNNSFDYDALIAELSESLITYALSRKEIKELVEKEKYAELSTRAKDRLRSSKVNDGELGELLLYCFLESHLKAPKLLTKMALKTSNNDYVKGTDAVHLLEINENSYQVILGESKTYKNVTDAISNAFISINEFKSDPQKRKFEISLIDSNLLKEVVSDEQYNTIKALLDPSESSAEVKIDDSFGIFIGFDYKYPEECVEFDKAIYENVTQIINDNLSTINTKMSEYNLTNYKFYFYFVPLNEIAKSRKDIIERIS